MGNDGKPDVRHIVVSAEAIAPFLRRGKLIVVESSVHSDMLDEVVVPILERGGLKAGDDFFAAFSLGLRDPGSNNHTLESISKIVGATSPEGLAAAEKLYRQVYVNVIPLSSADVVTAP
jgi:UDP-N-acetyl-D-glucosamine dehydrogenase